MFANCGFKKELYPAVISWISLNIHDPELLLIVSLSFISFNILETKHVIKNLTTYIIVTSKLVIHEPKYKIIYCRTFKVKKEREVYCSYKLYHHYLHDFFLNTEK